MRVAIILPVYNEAGNIEKNLDAIQEALKGLEDQVTLNLVYDRDEDDTLPVVRRVASRYSFPIVYFKNSAGGICNAIKVGLKQAEGECVLVTMADLSDDYAILPKMLAMAKNGCDVVCASRYMKGGKMHGGTFMKRNLSMLAGKSLHILTGIPTEDITNNYKIYRKQMLNGLTIESTGGFEIAMEITAKAFVGGYRIGEIPAQWYDRTAGQSKFKLLSWLPKYLKWYFYLIGQTWFKGMARHPAG